MKLSHYHLMKLFPVSPGCVIGSNNLEDIARCVLWYSNVISCELSHDYWGSRVHLVCNVKNTKTIDIIESNFPQREKTISGATWNNVTYTVPWIW